jgi:hypothetical protein
VQALLLLLGIGLSTHRAGRAHSKKLIAAPLLILLVLAGILFIRGGDGARGLPPGYTGAAYSLLYGYERSTDVVAPRCHRHQITYSQSASARSIQPP